MKNEPKPIVVMTELFCSLLLKESSILRTIIEKVFEVFCAHLDEEAVEVLTNAFTDPKIVSIEEEVTFSRSLILSHQSILLLK
jgi:hypothetical protein